jgi:hypothetical protein
MQRVIARNDFARSMFRAGFLLFAGAYRNLGVSWACTPLALLPCAFMPPIPILLYKYGGRIRMASKRLNYDFEHWYFRYTFTDR